MNLSSKTMEKAGWLIFVACTAGLILALSSARAATYYVSPSGDDASAGTSEKTPWKTAAKVRTAAFQPGNQILFARGGEWHEQLLASSSGAPGKPIVYDAFGAGAKPRFWGSDVLASANWKSLGGDLYSYPLNAAQVTEVLANHGTEPKGQWFNVGNPAGAAGQFDFSRGTLRIISPSDPRSDGRVYTAVVREDVIGSNGKDHLVFRNLEGDETANPNMGYVIRIEGSQDVTLESCDALRGGRHLIGVINSTGFIGKNLYAAYALPHNQTQGSTFYVSYSGAESKYSNTTSQYINCKAEHFEDGDGGQYLYFVCHGPKLGPISFVNPTDLGGKFSFLQDNPEQSVTVKGGLIRDADLELFANRALVDGVTFTGNSSIDIWSNNNVVQNCLMLIRPVGGGPTGYGTAILTRGGANGKNNVIRFNTVVIDPSIPDKCCLFFGASGQANSWYGNILLSAGVAVSVDCGKASSIDALQSDYNFYGPNTHFSPGYLTLDQWKALGFADQHSLSGDPRFANPAGNEYELAAGSPAIDAAKLDASLIHEVSADFNGSPRLQGSAFDMGAFEGAVKPVKTISENPSKGAKTASRN